jgi:hypothetical protein
MAMMMIMMMPRKRENGGDKERVEHNTCCQKYKLTDIYHSINYPF